MNDYIKKVKYLILKIKNRLFQGKPVLVLMYHRISDVVDPSNKHLTVSIANFEKQLQFFKKEYEVLRLGDSWLNLKKNGLVLTFDDGYADNYTTALPLLKKYNLPATIFVCSQNIDTTTEFWWDRLAAIYQCLEEDFYISSGVKTQKNAFSIKQICTLLGDKNSQEIDCWLHELEQINGLILQNRDQFRSLSLLELKALSNEPLIDIELHSNNHPSYSKLSLEQQIIDLELNISFLKKNILKSQYNYFAMPHGAYNADTFELIDKLNLKGFLLANNYYSNAVNKEKKKINRILMPSIQGKELRVYLRKYKFPF